MGSWLTCHLATLGHEVTAINTRTDFLERLGGLDLVVVSVPISAKPSVINAARAVNLAIARVLGGEDFELASRLSGSTFALQYMLAQRVAGEKPTLERDLIGCNTSLRSMLGVFIESLMGLVDASTDARRFASLHAEITGALSRDTSYVDAYKRRQRAHRAINGA